MQTRLRSLRRGEAIDEGVLVLLCIAAGSAPAQGGRGSETSTLTKYPGLDPLVAWAAIWGDSKSEGVYTCEQWKQYATKLFSEANRSHDGYLDTKEFEAVRKADRMLRDADLGYFDDNRDGRVSRREFVDKPNPFFALYDKKGTCKVTLDDISSVLLPAGAQNSNGIAADNRCPDATARRECPRLPITIHDRTLSAGPGRTRVPTTGAGLSSFLD